MQVLKGHVNIAVNGFLTYCPELSPETLNRFSHYNYHILSSHFRLSCKTWIQTSRVAWLVLAAATGRRSLHPGWWEGGGATEWFVERGVICWLKFCFDMLFWCAKCIKMLKPNRDKKRSLHNQRDWCDGCLFQIVEFLNRVAYDLNSPWRDQGISRILKQIQKKHEESWLTKIANFSSFSHFFAIPLRR